MLSQYLIDFPRYCLSEDYGPQVNYSTKWTSMYKILGPKTYEGFTVISHIVITYSYVK